MEEPVPGEVGELARLQRWFHAVVTHPGGVEAGLNVAAELTGSGAGGAVESIVTRSHALSAEERLNIYAQAYYTRLLECLGEIYPMLRRLLGEETFSGFAFGYLQKYPSRSYTLHELGRHWPRYLEETRPARGAVDSLLPADWPDFLVDLSRLEWGVYEVFDGPGVEGVALLSGESLLQIPPDRWAQARLRPVPCLQLLRARFPVNEYYTALRRDDTAEPPPLPEPKESFVALTRREFIVRRYPLAASEFALLRALCAGQRVGQAIESVFGEGDAEGDRRAAEVQGWFRRWTSEGFFQVVDA